MKKFLALLSISGALFAANYNSPVITQKASNPSACAITNKSVKTRIIRIEASGEGVVPCSGACSTAQARVMARRAAILDAYKALAEKMYGIKINGRDTVKNMILQNSSLRAYVYGLIRGAQIEEEDFKNGIYSVVMSVKLDVSEWNKYLTNGEACGSQGCLCDN